MLSAADRHDFTIVEDDISAELAPVRTANLASLDGLRRVVYVSSFSKAIAPNLRVGYVVARDERVQTLLRAKTIASLSSSGSRGTARAFDFDRRPPIALTWNGCGSGWRQRRRQSHGASPKSARD